MPKRTEDDGDSLKANPSHKVKVDPVETLIMGLRNHETIMTTESKDGSIVRRMIPEAKVAEAKAMLRSFFPASKSYRFRMTATFNIATNGSGANIGFQSFSPSVSSYNEWTALSALFDEVKGVSNMLTFVSSFGGTSTAIVLPIAVAPDYVNINTTPSSAASVNRLAESEILVGGLLTANKPRVKICHLPSDLLWATTATPAVQSPPSGCVGQWSFASQIIAGTVSITYFYVFMDYLIKLRMRA